MLFQDKRSLIEKIDVIRLELKERKHVKIKDPGILKKKEYNLTEYLGANIKRGIYKSF